MPRSFSLGKRFEDFIEAQVASGRYNNASEVVRDGLRMLESSQAPAIIDESVIQKLVQEGIDSGPGTDADIVFDRIERRLKAQIDAQKSET